jgi:NADPH:quinone reductase-like Zn-dependent oxidoreductase
MKKVDITGALMKTVLCFALLFAASTARGDETMTAVCIREFGGGEVLRVELLPRPAVKADEILVKVEAAGVNPVDWKIRSGTARGLVEKMPYVPGFDVSGVIEQIGEGVKRFKGGDEIYGMIDLRRGGAYAEYAVVKESEAAAKPKKASHADAASMPLVALTAWQALFEAGKLEKGQTVLIHGGAGGVGSMAVQLAKWKGAKVLATASESNLAFLRELRVDRAIDYREEKFEEVAKEVDVVLDTVGGETQAASFKALKKGGVLVSIVGQPSQERAKQFGVRAVSMLVKPSGETLEKIAQLVDTGKIRAVVTHVMPLGEVAKAHEQSETRHTRGKIVLTVHKH